MFTSFTRRPTRLSTLLATLRLTASASWGIDLPYSAVTGVYGDWPKILKAYLYCGVTSVVDFGVYPEMFAPMRRLLQGEKGAYRDAVLLNAAAALIVAGAANDGEEGVEEAAEAIDKGLANALLNCWIAWK